MEFRMLVDLISRLNANEREYHRAYSYANEREYHRAYSYGKIKKVQSLGNLMHELTGLEAPSMVGWNCVDVPSSLIIGLKSTTDPDFALCHG
jgi:hypothetical protein